MLVHTSKSSARIPLLLQCIQTHEQTPPLSRHISLSVSSALSLFLFFSLPHFLSFSLTLIISSSLSSAPLSRPCSCLLSHLLYLYCSRLFCSRLPSPLSLFALFLCLFIFFVFLCLFIFSLFVFLSFFSSLSLSFSSVYFLSLCFLKKFNVLNRKTENQPYC